MKIACPKCGREYRLDPSRIPAKGARFTCWGCQAKVEVRPLQPNQGDAPSAEAQNKAVLEPKVAVAQASMPPTTSAEPQPRKPVHATSSDDDKFITGPGISPEVLARKIAEKTSQQEIEAVNDNSVRPTINMPSAKAQPLKITCPKCRHEYRIDRSRIPAGGGKFTCRSCQARIEVRPSAKTEDKLDIPTKTPSQPQEVADIGIKDEAIYGTDSTMVMGSASKEVSDAIVPHKTDVKEDVKANFNFLEPNNVSTTSSITSETSTASTTPEIDSPPDSSQATMSMNGAALASIISAHIKEQNATAQPKASQQEAPPVEAQSISFDPHSYVASEPVSAPLVESKASSEPAVSEPRDLLATMALPSNAPVAAPEPVEPINIFNVPTEVNMPMVGAVDGQKTTPLPQISFIPQEEAQSEEEEEISEVMKRTQEVPTPQLRQTEEFTDSTPIQTAATQQFKEEPISKANESSAKEADSKKETTAKEVEPNKEISAKEVDAKKESSLKESTSKESDSKETDSKKEVTAKEEKSEEHKVPAPPKASPMIGRPITINAENAPPLSKSLPKPESKPEPKPEPKLEPKSEPKSGPKSEPKPPVTAAAPKLEPKSEPKPPKPDLASKPIADSKSEKSALKSKEIKNSKADSAPVYNPDIFTVPPTAEKPSTRSAWFIGILLGAVVGIPLVYFLFFSKNTTGPVTPTPQPTQLAVATPTVVETPGDSSSKTPEPIASKTPEPIASKTPEPIASKTPTPKVTPTPKATPTPKVTPTPKATPTPNPTPNIDTPPPAGNGRFTLQLGATPSQGESEALVKRLRGAGVDVYVVKADLGSRGIWYRIRTGRYGSANEAQKAGAELKAKGVTSEYAVSTYQQ